MTNEWTRPEHAEAYLARMNDIPHRAEGEATLLSEVPRQTRRVLDLGCGNGHLLALVLAHCPDATGVGLDFSPTMLQQARQCFAGSERVTLIEHNMDDPLPDLGPFDCVVSSFAIHHCMDPRKRQLYTEVFALLEPGGVFCNLEHVASPTPRIHDCFMEAMGIRPEDEDPSNKLLDVETQLQWLRQIGFEDVDCHWKWRELALLAGRKPREEHMTEADHAADGSDAVRQAYIDEACNQLGKAVGKIRHCLGQLSDEQIWWRPSDAQNSIANLILHLCGNVRQWIVSGVGGEADLRNRPQEFAERGPIPREELLRRLGEVLQQADTVLRTVPLPRLLEKRCIQGFETTGLSAIFDSVSHFTGHTQEIICLTRMQLGDRYQFDWVPATPEQGASQTGKTDAP